MKDFFFLSSSSGRGWRRTLGFALTESQDAFSHLCTHRCSKIAGKLIDGSVQRAHLQTSPDWCGPQSSRSHTTKTIIYLVLFAPWEKKTTPSSLHRSGNATLCRWAVFTLWSCRIAAINRNSFHTRETKKTTLLKQREKKSVTGYKERRRCRDCLKCVCLVWHEPYRWCGCRCPCPTPPRWRCRPAGTQRETRSEVSTTHTDTHTAPACQDAAFTRPNQRWVTYKKLHAVLKKTTKKKEGEWRAGERAVGKSVFSHRAVTDWLPSAPRPVNGSCRDSLRKFCGNRLQRHFPCQAAQVRCLGHYKKIFTHFLEFSAVRPISRLSRPANFLECKWFIFCKGAKRARLGSLSAIWLDLLDDWTLLCTFPMGSFSTNKHIRPPTQVRPGLECRKAGFHCVTSYFATYRASSTTSAFSLLQIQMLEMLAGK